MWDEGVWGGGCVGRRVCVGWRMCGVEGVSAGKVWLEEEGYSSLIPCHIMITQHSIVCNCRRFIYK